MGILILCMLFFTGITIKNRFFPSGESVKLYMSDIKNWQELELSGYRNGTENAPVQIIEIFDYQCTFCKRVQPTVAAIKEKYGSKIAVIHEHFPLSGHQYAFGAAIAAECARNQGKFQVFHRLLFKNQNQLGNLSYVSVAQLAGVSNPKTFAACVKNQETKTRVISGLNLSKRLQVSAIPTFIINGKLVTGALSRQQLSTLVEEALAEAKR